MRRPAAGDAALAAWIAQTNRSYVLSNFEATAALVGAAIRESVVVETLNGARVGFLAVADASGRATAARLTFTILYRTPELGAFTSTFMAPLTIMIANLFSYIMPPAAIETRFGGAEAYVLSLFEGEEEAGAAKAIEAAMSAAAIEGGAGSAGRECVRRLRQVLLEGDDRSGDGMQTKRKGARL